jgi:uncharacterized protein with FMN-binding domain
MIKPGKLLLSGGLILASGGYAWWQDQHPIAVPAPVASKAPVRKPPAAAPMTPPTTPPVTAPAAVAVNQPPPILKPAPAPAPEAVVKPKAPRLRPLTKAEISPAPPPPDKPPPEPLNAVQLAPQPNVSTGRYLDGEFVGNAFDGEWGPVQVKAVIRNGDLADVIVLEYPIHRQRSAEISEWAIPMLYEEAIKAQSAKIDMVAQASFTSENFQQSLASALARATRP